MVWKLVNTGHSFFPSFLWNHFDTFAKLQFLLPMFLVWRSRWYWTGWGSVMLFKLWLVIRLPVTSSPLILLLPTEILAWDGFSYSGLPVAEIIYSLRIRCEWVARYLSALLSFFWYYLIVAGLLRLGRIAKLSLSSGFIWSGELSFGWSFRVLNSTKAIAGLVDYCQCRMIFRRRPSARPVAL